MISLDSAAATPVHPAVLEAMLPFFQEPGNSSSLHSAGVRARQALENAREGVASFLNVSASEIFFTSGGTEAINLGLKGFYEANRKRGNRILSSPVESVAVLRSLDWLRGQGAEIDWVPVDREGAVDPAAIAAALTSETILVCVQWANGETGTIQPIPEIAQICQETSATLFCDATASAGWLPIDLRQISVPLFAFHFRGCGGPVGVGALRKQEGIALWSQLHGGSQEKGLRAGTENLPGIVGAVKAVELTTGTLAASASRLRTLSSKLWESIHGEIPALHWHGPPPGEQRLPHHLAWSAEGAEGEAQVLACDLKGVAIAAGPSCISKSLRGSHVLREIGIPQRLAMSAVSVTLSKETSEENLHSFCQIYTGVIERLRAMSPAWQLGKGRLSSQSSVGEASP
ncbi:cysteine desulfurase family protein [Verrucomicrobium sp. 3C]|uniref:cysteine desulfurase family protein n=1 Tax=Verrucomicrobium sp. 3C TaxID=1134055 RepID=UPI0003725DDD|nr:cysteine desulfurase family protein [Verrucomicrobium sp. 3C]